MAIASLEFARIVPARSSGVSVGRNFSNCSTVVIRFLSCHLQSFQSSSETWFQKPLLMDLNSLSPRSLESVGASSAAPAEALFILRQLYFGLTLCQGTGAQSRRRRCRSCY